MVWLTWRQHRVQALVTAALLALAAVLLLADALPTDVVKMLPWAPVLIGLFWGVPLFTKEFERGTYRVVWTQTVTRRRWMLVKFGMLGTAVALAGLAAGGVVTAFAADQPGPDGFSAFAGDLFGASGIAPVGWYLFLFALGATAGAFLRRMLPAMAVTIAVFAALVFGAFLGRPYYAEPELSVGSLESGNTDPVPPNALTVSHGWMNADGTMVDMNDTVVLCPGPEQMNCLADKGYDRFYTYYHPESRYWRFQLTETALLVLGAVALASLTAYRTIRRA